MAGQAQLSAFFGRSSEALYPLAGFTHSEVS